MKHGVLILSITLLALACGTPKQSTTIESDNLYPIGKNELWGFANENGELSIDFKFENIAFFKHRRAAVKQEGKYGLINPQGEFELMPEYDSIPYFDLDKAFVIKVGRHYWVDKNGNEIIHKNGIQVNGKGRIPTEASKVLNYFYQEENNYLLNTLDLTTQQKLNPSANLLISDFTFSEVTPFSSHSFIVKKDKKFGIYVHNNHIGLKDVWADEILPFFDGENYDGNVNEGHYAKYRIGNKWGIVSKLGKIEIEEEFYSIKESIEEYFIVEYKPGYWGCMTLKERYF